jgi:hypothetical protein
MISGSSFKNTPSGRVEFQRTSSPKSWRTIGGGRLQTVPRRLLQRDMVYARRKEKSGHADMQKRNVLIHRCVALSFVVFLSAANAMAEDPSSNLWTGKSPNGRAWELLPNPAKTMYVIGFTDGVTMAGSVAVETLGGRSSKLGQTVAKAIGDQLEVKGFTNGEFVKELDKFYSDRENIRIQIFVALSYCTLKLGGTYTNAELEQLLIKFRKNASAPEEVKP